MRRTSNHEISNQPLRGWIRAVKRVLELNDVPVLLLELALVLHVVLHQLRQRGELLPAIEIVKVARVLDLDVGDLAILTPARKRKFNKYNCC